MYIVDLVNLVDPTGDPPPTSSPEDVGALNLLSLSISAPNTPPSGLRVDDGEDSLFVPENPPPVSQPAVSGLFENSMSETATQLVPPRHAGDEEDVAEFANLSAGDRTLYRDFYEYVRTAEER